jgi:hypothetical protein
MPLTFEHIIEAADLYEAIQNLNNLSADEEINLADVLAEHYDDLNKHDLKEQFADNLVLSWPDSHINELGTAIRAIHIANEDEDSETTLYNLLAIRFEARKILMSIVDTHNTKPHEQFLDGEFNADRFNACDTFSSNLVNNANEETIVQRLTQTTPSNQRSKVARNVHLAFPNSTLAVAVGTAFEGVRNQELAGISRLNLFQTPYTAQAEDLLDTPRPR